MIQVCTFKVINTCTCTVRTSMSDMKASTIYS